KSSFLFPASTSVLGPNRAGSGIGVPVPSNVTLKSLSALVCVVTVAPITRANNPTNEANVLDMVATFRWWLNQQPHLQLWGSQCPFRVIRVIVVVGRLLPVFPWKRTSSGPVAMSQRGQL